MRNLRTVAVFALLTAVCLLVVPAPPAAQSQPLTAAGGTAAAALSSAPAIQVPVIPYCGSYCDTPGVSRGCIDNSGGYWKRVTCTCSGGSWVCGVY